MNKIDRRTFVQRTGLAGLSMLAAGLSSQRALADPDPPADRKSPLLTQAILPDPDIYPFQLGGVEAFIVHDGFISMPGIQPSFAPEATPSEIEEILRANFLPVDHISLSLNVLVVKAKSGVMLFDAGAGRSFGPATGRLVRGLARIGVSPNDVKTVFVTHAHLDHIGGLVDEANKPVFASARVLAAKTEVDFWMSAAPDLSGMRTAPETKAQAANGAKNFFGNLKANLELKEPGKLSSEVELIAAPGHTPGHSLFRIGQGDETLLVIGDAVHVHALQFPHPEWTMAYDVDPSQAVSTRRKLFKQAAADRTTLVGYHMPFPGIGHVRVAGKGYEWVPRPWVI